MISVSFFVGSSTPLTLRLDLTAINRRPPDKKRNFRNTLQHEENNSELDVDFLSHVSDRHMKS